MKPILPAILVLMVPLVLVSCSKDDEDPVTPSPPPPTLTWAGSDACAECHEVEYFAWKDSGHAAALTGVAGAAPDSAFPSFSAFANDPAPPPIGHDWEDVSFVIGGYSWKMIWLDADGFLITGDDAQYNFEDRSRAAFLPEGIPGPRPFDCGRCHATGWEGPKHANNKDELPGIAGSFFAGGIHCEECHGMGSFHVAEPDSHRMVVDRSSETCARCHRRLAGDAIAASDGFILNYQQYSEWLASPHGFPGGPGCNDCHDPHASVMFAEAELTGITRNCEGCHPGFGPLDGNNHQGATCVECHMAKAVLSAVSSQENVGDVRSHIIRLSSSFVKEDSMFTEAGDRVRLDQYGQAAITGDFTCMVCHQSGKSAPPLTSESLLGGAWRAHGSR